MTAATPKPRAKRLPKWARSAEALRAKWTERALADPLGVFRQLWPDSRRLRCLAAVAMYRHPMIYELLSDQRHIDMVEVTEKWAEGLCTDFIYSAAFIAHQEEMKEAFSTWYLAEDAMRKPDVLAYQSRILVAVVGPGWRFRPAWRTDTAVALARVMYESREWSAMPILADAIQDAGCEELALLDEMRSAEAVWCRGARIVDELLGKR